MFFFVLFFYHKYAIGTNSCFYQLKLCYNWFRYMSFRLKLQVPRPYRWYEVRTYCMFITIYCTEVILGNLRGLIFTGLVSWVKIRETRIFYLSINIPYGFSLPAESCFPRESMVHGTHRDVNKCLLKWDKIQVPGLIPSSHTDWLPSCSMSSTTLHLTHSAGI